MKSPAVFFALLLAPAAAKAEPWPTWRGDLAGSGSTHETGLPTEWGEEKNVRWRIDLPEAGNSTPIIHDDKVFVTQPVTDTKWRGLMCFSRKDGSLLWKNGVTYDKEERTHRSNPFCSASPATDGKLVVAVYGSAGIAAYDFDGKELWHRDLGAIDHVWGNSTSPVIHGDLVIHYHGPAKNAVLYGLNKQTGETVWQWNEPVWKPGKRTDGFKDSDGEGVIGSWSTPILVNTGERDELIMSFPMEMKAFDPTTGKELWTCSGLNPLVYTSPVYEDGIVVAMGGYFGNSIGVKVGGNGDVTGSHRLWQEVRHNGGIGTGLIKDGYYYYHDSGGVVYCDDIKTGKTLWKDRLPGAGKSWGSFVRSGDLIYTLSQAGDTVVFKASPEQFEVVAQSKVGEETNASLAISDGDIFLRTHEGLWCLAGQ
ncbi:MAG: PQQ-like beta-propeller repeat protein [Verrucomicrobiae bacterium]|nr:PQQ-like beta-propeller repeat protein [Verrucomicrobiae bacterium]